MNVRFFKKYSIDSESGGVNFWINVDNKEIYCFISIEALQDYNPRNRNEDVLVLFELYKSDIRNIVEKKVNSSDFKIGNGVIITSKDLCIKNEN